MRLPISGQEGYAFADMPLLDRFAKLGAALVGSWVSEGSNFRACSRTTD